MRQTRVRSAILVGALALLTSCGAGDQGSPEGVLEAYVEHLSAGEYAEACELVDDATLALVEGFGGCQSGIAAEYPADEASAFADAAVHRDALKVHGDGALIGDGAVTVNGDPVDLGFEALVKHDGKWWLAA